MIKSILVPTDGSESATIGVDYAIEWAKHYKAKLHGLHVLDVKLLEGPFLRDISASLGTAPYANYQGNMAMILEERGKAALTDFSKRCEAAGVSYATELASGIIPSTIVEESNLSDIIIMGRGGEHNEWLEGLLGSNSESVIRRAQRPVVVTARLTPAVSPFVVAYDGSDNAKRALQLAANVSHDWNMTLHVLSIQDHEPEQRIAEAREYLEPHEVAVEYVARSGDAPEGIVAYAAEVKAGLLVMGAFGHSRVRELVVGSTTAHVINHASCPLMMTR